MLIKRLVISDTMANDNKKQVLTLNENDFQNNVAQDFKPPYTANTINYDQIIDFCALSRTKKKLVY